MTARAEVTTMIRRICVHAFALLLISCGSPTLADRSTAPEQTASSPDSSDGRPQTTTAALPAVVSDDELATRVAQAFVTRTMFPSSYVANLLLTNRAHRKVVIDCLSEAGFAEYGYDTSDPPILPEMVETFQFPLRWVSPPRGFVELPSPPPGLELRDPYEPGWVPPEMPADRLIKFEEAINTCENSSPFPSAVDYRGAEEIDAEMKAIESDTLKSAEFAPIAEKYIACVAAQGGRTPPTGFGEGWLLGPPDPQNAGKFDAVTVDAQCRTPLYPKFVELRAKQWREWLDRRTDDLVELAADWARIEKDAGIG